MILLAIDPGINTGWAFFQDDKLFACGKNEMPNLFAPDYIVIEIPRIRQGGKTDQIITLAVTAGRLLQHARITGHERTYGVFPERWKGQVPKEVHNMRVLGRLTDPERQVFERAVKGLGKKDDVLDAIGIGQWACSRIPVLPAVADHTFGQIGFVR